MNNFEYQNIDEILSSGQPIRGSRYFVQKERRVIVPLLNAVDNLDEQGVKDSFEMHLFYNDGGYVGSIYDLKSWIPNDELNPTNINLDILSDLDRFILQPGPYRFVYNFFRNYVGSEFSKTKLFIAEISNDRRELVLALTNPADTVQINNLKNFVLEYLKPKKYFPPIVLNFGENKIVDVINVTSDGSETYFYVKLFYPLPMDLGLRYECWLATQILKPYIDRVNVLSSEEQAQNAENVLRGPNYSADYTYNTVSETDFKSWTDLLSTSVQTSQELLNSYVYGDTKPVKINVDFTFFTNFCFYSSAVERLNNFVYKMSLLENYNTEIENLMSYLGSTDDLEKNIVNVKNLKEKLITGFDEWEKWLYYENYDYDPFVVETNVITPYPKYEVSSNQDITTKNGKFKFWKTTEGPGIEWYNATLALAVDFDNLNQNTLYKTLPSHIKEDPQNEQFISFVNMIGQHFDVIFTYTEQILSKNLRQENTKLGLSQDLVQTVTKNFGWNLSSNISDKELWEYALGLNDDVDPKYNILGEKYNKTEEERTKEVWRRILNNLPYIYRTKGTSRGIRALLAAYGIPQTLLTIREYGGAYNPNSYDLGKNLYEKSTYYLNFEGSFSGKNQKIEIPWQKVNHYDEWKYPDTITFRWKMQPESFYSYALDKKQTILQKSSSNGVDWFITINKNDSNDEKGDISFYIGTGSSYLTASITDEYLYDDIPLNLMVRRNKSTNDNTETLTYDLILKTEKYGKIVIDKKSSITVNGATNPIFNQLWNTDGKLFIGSGSNSETSHSLVGSIFELRYWSNPLSTSSFDNHVLSARSYNGNTPSSSFYDLQGQWKFWQYFNPQTTSSIESSHPNQNKTNFYTSSKSANIIGFTTSSFENITETYLMEISNIGASTEYSQKIRIDSSSLSGALNTHTTNEKSSLEMNSIDSNKLMVAFSPQTIINEDIYEATGDVDLSEYLGGYDVLGEDEYVDLKLFASEYWQKYQNRNDFNAYISLISKFDLSVFEQIRQTLPARSNEILGLVIEQNVLERSKVYSVKGLSGQTDGFVQESNTLSPFPKSLPSEYDTKSTTLFLGFEEGDSLEIKLLESEYNVSTIVESESDDNIKLGDMNANLVSKGDASYNKTTKIITPLKKTPPKVEYRSYGSTLKTDLVNDIMYMKSNTYQMSIKPNEKNNIKGEMFDLKNFGKVDLNFTTSGSLAFLQYSTYSQISNYESSSYYKTVIPYSTDKYSRSNRYLLLSGSIFRQPKEYETAKQTREFLGCNDYPYPYKNSIRPEATLYTLNSNLLDYRLIRENFEDTSYQFNDTTLLRYNSVSNAGSVVETNIFPSSSFWKTNIRGDFFDGSFPPRNVFGMSHSAPRIIRLNTATISSTKKLFSTQYLQESVIEGTKKYLNYPTSQDYIRGFPWVLTWSGSNSSIPNLGPDLGFTAQFYINDDKTVVNSLSNPQLQ